MKEGENFKAEKIPAEEMKKISAIVSDIAKALNQDIVIKDDPDTITLTIKNKKGEVEKAMGFMKIEKIPVGSRFVDLNDVVTARLLFPDEDVENAVNALELKRKMHNAKRD